LWGAGSCCSSLAKSQLAQAGYMQLNVKLILSPLGPHVIINASCHRSSHSSLRPCLVSLFKQFVVDYGYRLYSGGGSQETASLSGFRFPNFAYSFRSLLARSRLRVLHYNSVRTPGLRLVLLTDGRFLGENIALTGYSSKPVYTEHPRSSINAFLRYFWSLKYL
jgi:hypothetical protein